MLIAKLTGYLALICALGKFSRAQYDLLLIANTSISGLIFESPLRMLLRKAVPWCPPWMQCYLEFKLFANQASLKFIEDEISKIHGLWWCHYFGLRFASRLRQSGPSF
jgi:hypothetical protein